MKLVYVGNGYLPGVPARDLNDEEVEQYGGEAYLLATKLYVKPHDDKMERGRRQDKSEVSGGN